MAKQRNLWKTLAILLSTTVICLILLLGITISQVSANTSERILAQRSNTSQLKDVQPSDYYYQSLQSLIEKYGVNVAYSDGNFRAYLPMTRGDFAVFLNSALDTLSRKIAIETTDLGSKEELAKLQRLTDQLEAEVKSLEQGTRVDHL